MQKTMFTYVVSQFIETISNSYVCFYISQYFQLRKSNEEIKKLE